MSHVKQRESPWPSALCSTLDAAAVLSSPPSFSSIFLDMFCSLSLPLHAAISVLPPFKILAPVRFQCHLLSRAAEQPHRSATTEDALRKMRFTRLYSPHFHPPSPQSNPKHPPSFPFWLLLLPLLYPFLLHSHPTSFPPTPLPLFFLCILCNRWKDPASASSAAWLLFLSHHAPRCQAACRHSEVHLSFVFCT